MRPVSILVVMDLALQLSVAFLEYRSAFSFNPCCNGFSVATYEADLSIGGLSLCFNPCCNGFSVATVPNGWV